MIDMDFTLDEGVLAVRFHGTVTDREFMDLAAKIADFEPMSDALLYLDWLAIDRWAPCAPKANREDVWRKASQVIKRVAIVHDRRLNRQAAWLAAVLRLEGIEVRSWQPERAAAGAVWLRMPTATPS